MNLFKGDRIGGRTVVSIKFEIPMLWCGWESDSKAWAVILDDGTKAIIGSSHGILCLFNEHDLNNKIIEYQRAVNDTKKAVNFLS